jgi:hypothetical protein
MEKEAVVKGHTPEPWKWVEDPSDYGSPTTTLEPNVLSIYESHGGGWPPKEADARLIADAPRLLKENERLRKALGLIHRSAHDRTFDVIQIGHVARTALEET